MIAYLIRRLVLVPPVLLAIITINFLIVQVAPGGPVEQLIAQIRGRTVSATARVSGEAAGEAGGRSTAASSAEASSGGKYRGAQGLDPELIKQIERQFGMDKPLHERYWLMLKKFAVFDLGESFFRSRKVVDLVIEKMPVSISLGLWSTLLIYLISIPLGIAKAVRDGSRFDVATSTVIIIGYAIPGFLFAILLIVLFAGGSYWKIFPLGGLVSEGWRDLPLGQKVLDYLWHMVLPVTTLVMGGFAGLTMLTKNSFLDEIHKQYVVTARAKGLGERQVLYGHVFRNAMLIVISGFPSAFVSILFTGALLTEMIFSLDGLGLMGYEAAISRDYPVMFGTLFMFTLLGLLLNIVGDFMYVVVDPRIDFERREG